MEPVKVHSKLLNSWYSYLVKVPDVKVLRGLLQGPKQRLRAVASVLEGLERLAAISVPCQGARHVMGCDGRLSLWV